MKKLIKNITVLALLATLVLNGFAASADAAGTRPGFDAKKAGGKFIFSVFSDATRLIPYTTNDSVSNHLQGFMFDGLMSVDLNSKPIPWVAESYTVSADGKVYTFKMRKDVKFWDGTPMTSADVKFSFDMYRHKDSINPYTENFGKVVKVETPDAYTVKITLSERDVFFLYSAGAGIISKKQFPKGLEDFNKNTKIHRNPMGSGPFKFKEWKTAERVVLTANKNWFKGRPYFDEVIMKILPDANVETVNLLKGDIDFIEVLQAKNVAQVQKDKDLKVLKYDQARFDIINLNMKRPQFKERAVRQALAMALDRQAMLDKFYLGSGSLASGPYPPILAHNNKAVKAREYDIKEANKILDAAGWKLNSDGIREKNGVKLEFELTYNNGNKIRQEISTIAKANWKKLGVKVNVRSYDFSILLEKEDNGEIDSRVAAWTLGDDMDVYGIFHTGEGSNSTFISDPEIDKLTDAIRSEPNDAKRIKLYQDLHKEMALEEYSIWLYHPGGFAGIDKDIAGYKFSLISRWYNIYDWYWKKK